MNVKHVFALIFLFHSIAAIQSAPTVGDGPIVQTTTGPVQGQVWTTPEGRDFNAFLGIPFGKAPVGELRFKASK